MTLLLGGCVLLTAPEDPLAVPGCQGADCGTPTCQAWDFDFEAPAWEGDLASCTPGSDGLEQRTLDRINVLRSWAGLHPATLDTELNEGAQACALIMRAAGELNHDPPSSWDCWTQEGAQAAGSSNISGYSSERSILSYMIDGGNEDTLGHRRWILDLQLGAIGVGGTDAESCLLVHGGQVEPEREWVAWPPAGPVPMAALRDIWERTDEVGWSVQSDTLRVDQAQVVAVDPEGQELPFELFPLPENYGSTYAMRLVPQGWHHEAGLLTVVVEGPDFSFEYEVELLDCQ